MRLYYDGSEVSNVAKITVTRKVDAVDQFAVILTDQTQSDAATWRDRRFEKKAEIFFDDEKFCLKGIVEEVKFTPSSRTITLNGFGTLQAAAYGTVDENYILAEGTITDLSGYVLTDSEATWSDDEWNGKGCLISDQTGPATSTTVTAGTTPTVTYIDKFGNSGSADTNTGAADGHQSANDGKEHYIAKDETSVLRTQLHVPRLRVEYDFDCSSYSNLHYIESIVIHSKATDNAGEPRNIIRIEIKDQTAASGDEWKQIATETATTSYGVKIVPPLSQTNAYFDGSGHVQIRITARCDKEYKGGAGDVSIYELHHNLYVDYIALTIWYDADDDVLTHNEFAITDTSAGPPKTITVDALVSTYGVKIGDAYVVAEKNQVVLQELIGRYIGVNYDIDDDGHYCARRLRGITALRLINDMTKAGSMHYWVEIDQDSGTETVKIKDSWTDNSVTLTDSDIDEVARPVLSYGREEYGKVIVFGGRKRVGDGAIDVYGEAVSTTSDSPKVLVINDASILSDTEAEKVAEGLLALHEDPPVSLTMRLKDSASNRALQPGEVVSVSATSLGLSVTSEPITWIQFSQVTNGRVNITVHVGLGSTPASARTKKEMRALKSEVSKIAARLISSQAEIQGVTRHQDLTGIGEDDHHQKFENLVEDTSPQLGGDLDTNGNALKDDTRDYVEIKEKYVRITGNTTGNANYAWLGFYQSDGTRTGYVGDGSSSDQHMRVVADQASLLLMVPSAGQIYFYKGGSAVGSVDEYNTHAYLKSRTSGAHWYFTDGSGTLTTVHAASFSQTCEPIPDRDVLSAVRLLRNHPKSGEIDKDLLRKHLPEAYAESGGVLCRHREINLGGMVNVLIKAVQELADKLDALGSRVIELEKAMEVLLE